MSSIALVDCNNFYVSCERIFQPKLIGKPVVVLSNNDGCIIARSQEAKRLGIPMGAPLFQWAEFLRIHDVGVLSSNFALYGDFSSRVMEILASSTPEIEIYSIDEAFLCLKGIANPADYCRKVREKILKWTGIPVSIGIAPTKTLAKVANHRAKRDPSLEGVYAPTLKEISSHLETLPVEEIWGIGRRLTACLEKWGIRTAAQFRNQPEEWVRKSLSVVSMRTLLELRGISCLPIEEVPPQKKSTMTSRSFSIPILAKEDLEEAVASFAARGAEKLRKEGLCASWIQVFIMTSPFQKEEAFYRNQALLTFPEPTSYTPKILSTAKKALQSIFRHGYAYKKAGVLLGDLVPETSYQQDLFSPQNPHQKKREKALMHILDRSEARFGYRALQFAAEGITPAWKRPNSSRSPCFTTRWPDLLTIHI
ncbi:MAG: DNA polymerase IV 1 [Chlamydiae bacterium]|nr:DNA polymerase IV 1 [Chlamydiota bacterium]